MSIGVPTIGSRRMKEYYVYIMTNKRHTVLYTGITNSLLRRNFEHREKIGSKFTAKYNVDKLVYYEIHNDIESAIKREKQVKNLIRKKKIDLIGSRNPSWSDLWTEFFT